MAMVTLLRVVETSAGSFPVGAELEIPNPSVLNSGYVEAVINSDAVANGFGPASAFVILAPGEYRWSD